MLRRPFFLLLFLMPLFAACAGMNDAMTPSMEVKQSNFDGHVYIYQEPVSASSGMSEGWHTLGFEWHDTYPDTIVITVGADGITNIFEVHFNADGDIIKSATPTGVLTDYGKYSKYTPVRWSTRRFTLTWDEFVQIATASDVRMKVVKSHEYSVSSFGPANSGATVNTKLPPFMAEVGQRRVQ